METLQLALEVIENWVWGVPLLTLLIGTGIYLTILLRGMQFRYLGFAFRQVFARRSEMAKGDISHYEALMTTLAGAIGTGAIVGVSTGIAIGGMGSLFWMWITALFSMATKYSESLLAVKYRELDRRGEMIGGPMEYIEKGMGKRWLAILFAGLGIVAAIGTGNLVQVNSIAAAVNSTLKLDPWITGIALAFITGLTVVGGVRGIGHIAAVLVPFMSLFYISGGLFIIAKNLDKVPDVFMTIVTSAFTGQAAAGGFLGSTLMAAIQMGVSRGIFSNEAGLGISAIAAAAAKTDAPARQAMISMTGALVSTIIVCSITGLVIGVTGVLGMTDESGKLLTGVSMAIAAFDSSIHGGNYVVAVGLVLFAFSTVVAWGYYGEKCCEYLFGERSIPWYRIVFTLIVIPGAAIEMDAAWSFANIANGLMAVPNLIALIALSGVIVKETRDFIEQLKKEKENVNYGVA
jgi:AGCS family alanine or glycine:cation symporter